MYFIKVKIFGLTLVFQYFFKAEHTYFILFINLVSFNNNFKTLLFKNFVKFFEIFHFLHKSNIFYHPN